MRAAALRLGSQGVPKSYDDHLIIVGDAAGHIDPLTGEGIHTAMMVGCSPVLRHLLSRHMYLWCNPIRCICIWGNLQGKCSLDHHMLTCHMLHHASDSG